MASAFGGMDMAKPVAVANWHGLMPYRSFADSQTAGFSYGESFRLEDFEDGLVNTPLE